MRKTILHLRILAYWHMEEEQQLIRFRQHWLFQRQQQYDELGSVKRWFVGVSGAKSNINLAGSASKTDQTEESDRESEDERRMVGLFFVDHGAGYSRIRHAQAKVQVLLLL